MHSAWVLMRATHPPCRCRPCGRPARCPRKISSAPACAAAVAAAQWGLATPTDGKMVVHMDGGRATVELDTPEPGAVRLTGPAVYIATIEIDIT